MICAKLAVGAYYNVMDTYRCNTHQAKYLGILDKSVNGSKTASDSFLFEMGLEASNKYAIVQPEVSIRGNDIDLILVVRRYGNKYANVIEFVEKTEYKLNDG